MNSTRLTVRTKLNDILCSEKKSKNIEISIYNWMINYEVSMRNSKQKSSIVVYDYIQKSWNDKFFKRIYLSKCRSIIFNLKNVNNPIFKLHVLNGKISLNDIPYLSSQDIFPSMWEPIIQKQITQEQKSLKNANDILETAVEGMYTCSKCKCKKITYFELQTRSADEPMTIYFTCLNCEHRWKE